MALGCLKWIKQNEINSPLYWFKENNEWYEFKLSGIDKLDLEAPCMHISFYEAAAFARFKGLRLPTEYEWERASQEILSDQNSFLNLMSLEGSLPQLENNFMGTLWQWTNSSYLPYPGHIWEEGPLGEYNSKFMLNQMVLRGGSFGTNREHFRTTYRNFFYPHERWMFSGFRLAKDIR